MFKFKMPFIKKGNLQLPYMYDPATQKSSLTALFAYMSFILVIASIVALHFKPALIVACSLSIFVWMFAMVLYLMRHLTKAKIDLANKSFDLEGDDSDTVEKAEDK
jgi:hypothetical protein